MTPWSIGRFTFALLLVAFLVRLGAVLILRDIHTGPRGIISADDVEFDVLARNLAAGRGYADVHGHATSFRAPGWPALVAAVYVLVGERPEGVYLLNCGLGALSAWLTYRLGRRLLDERAGRAAGWLLAFYLPHIYFATVYWSENLFVPLLAGGAWLLLRYLDRPSLAWPLLAGLLLGAAILTRPFALLLVPLWVGVVVHASGWSRRGLLAGLVLGGVSLLVMVPWTWRNYTVHHRPVLVATNGGSTFYGGNNDRVVNEWRLWGGWVSTVELPHRDRIEAAPDEVAHDRVEWELGLQWVSEHPGAAVVTIPLKLLRLTFWLPEFDGGGLLMKAIRAASYWPLVPLLLLGLWCSGRDPRLRQPDWLLIHAVTAATVLTAVIFWGAPRFRDAAAPVMLLYVIVGGRALGQWLQLPARFLGPA